MKKYVKRIFSGMVTAALAVTLFAVPAMAGGDCGYGTDDIEDECDLWMVDNATEHWCVCYNHLDENGEYPITFGPEPHTFEDGRCTMCGRSQSNDTAAPDEENGNADNTEFETVESSLAAMESGAGTETVDGTESISAVPEPEGGLNAAPIIVGVAVLAVGAAALVIIKKKRGRMNK